MDLTRMVSVERPVGDPLDHLIERHALGLLDPALLDHFADGSEHGLEEHALVLVRGGGVFHRSDAKRTAPWVPVAGSLQVLIM